MPTQNVNLTTELDGFVKKQVQSGYFNNASEVHRAALSAMCKQDEERRYRVERLKVEVQKGIDSLAEGDVLSSSTDIRSSIRGALDSLLAGSETNPQ